MTGTCAHLKARLMSCLQPSISRQQCNIFSPSSFPPLDPHAHIPSSSAVLSPSPTQAKASFMTEADQHSNKKRQHEHWNNWPQPQWQLYRPPISWFLLGNIHLSLLTNPDLHVSQHCADQIDLQPEHCWAPSFFKFFLFLYIGLSGSLIRPLLGRKWAFSLLPLFLSCDQEKAMGLVSTHRQVCPMRQFSWPAFLLNPINIPQTIPR